MKLGAIYRENGKCEFTVWAPMAEHVSVIIYPENRIIPMQKGRYGYWNAAVEKIQDGTLYKYKIGDEEEYPDPASNFQPEGTFGPSAVVNHSAFEWTDQQFTPHKLQDMIIYELHIGTYTENGTFRAVIDRLDELKDLGITTIEIMPVAQFSGDRNWGYDGVYPYAPQNSYGGPQGLKELVNAAHMRGISVVLDVVYNHFGPEGNYISKFGPYFTGKYKTPWGDSINYDDEYSDEVRNFFFENALYWLRNYHIDALRLDAVHSIYDMSAKHFLQELNQKIDELGREMGKDFIVIAESDLNDSRIIAPVENGGYNCEAQWSDDFHHALHSLLTGEKSGYYEDFGKTEHLVKALSQSYVYAGDYSRSRKRKHGNSAGEFPAWKFVVSTQNHDQIGNRAFGERLSTLLNFEGTKLAAGVLLLSPYVPLLFMGEEYREDSPFMYFVSHSDSKLVEAVQNGRRNEFRAFEWQDEVPDPQSIETFMISKLKWEKRVSGKNKILLDFYKLLIELRKELPALRNFERDSVKITVPDEDRVIIMNRTGDNSSVFMAMNFNNSEITVISPSGGNRWKRIIDSADINWSGGGAVSPADISQDKSDITLKEQSFVLYEAL